jgi:ABC-type proline/glycine betaine transport system permease subunit
MKSKVNAALIPAFVGLPMAAEDRSRVLISKVNVVNTIEDIAVLGVLLICSGLSLAVIVLMY